MLDTAQCGARRDPVEIIGSDERPGERCADRVAAADAHPIAIAARTRWVGLDENPAGAAEQALTAPQQAHRIAADADVAVGEQYLSPAALARQRFKNAAAQRVHATGAGEFHRGGGDV